MRGEAPYRRAVIMQRNTRNVLVEDQWEEWEDLSFRQQWRRSHPSYLNITVFACNPNAEVANSAKPAIQEMEPAGPSQSATLDGSSVDAAMPEPMHPMPSPARSESQETASESCEPSQVDLNSSNHGPRFLTMSPENKKIALRLHKNLGHPDPQKLSPNCSDRQP